MTTAGSLPTCSLISNPASLSHALDVLCSMPRDPPSLYVDLEGNNLSREGTLSIITIFVAPRNHVYIIDVYKMRSATFSTTRARGTTTLKKVLESGGIPKVFFDVRNDADALYSLYGVELRGAQDLQLMELACRPGDAAQRRYVASLAQCIEADAGLNVRQRMAWKAAKSRMATLFNASTRDNATHVFNQRPLAHEAIQYCADDVRFLPRLLDLYTSLMTSSWQSKAEKETKNRVSASQKPSYVPHGPHKALGPWNKALKSKLSLSDQKKELENIMLERRATGDFENEMWHELANMLRESDAKEREEALSDDTVLQVELNVKKLDDDGDTWWKNNGSEDWSSLPDRLKQEVKQRASCQ